jgi:hypothetical protein
MKNLTKFEKFSVINNQNLSEHFQYHIQKNLGLLESEFRIGSESWINLVNEARDLHEMGEISLSEDDLFLISTDAGKLGVYEGEEVYLDVPFFESDVFDGDIWFDADEGKLHESKYVEISEAEYRGRKVNLNKPFRTPSGPKKFAVYTKNDKGNVVKVTFGLKGATVKNYDREKAKSFQARHRCKTPGPKWKPRWWSCNLGKFSKILGLSSSRSW